MIEQGIQSAARVISEEPTELTSSGVGESDAQLAMLKKRRALHDVSIVRVRKFIEQGAEMRKRVEKEMLEIRKTFMLARGCHAEMYKFADEEQISAMDNWEENLIKDFYDIEQIEQFLKSLSMSHPANTMSQNNHQILEQSSSSSENVTAGLHIAQS